MAGYAHGENQKEEPGEVLLCKFRRIKKERGDDAQAWGWLPLLNQIDN